MFVKSGTETTETTIEYNACSGIKREFKGRDKCKYQTIFSDIISIKKLYFVWKTRGLS